MAGSVGDKRERLLDPVDRISEILFGLIMAVTIVGSLSVATAGHNEARTVTVAALGCNLAWGLVDAVMYLVRTMTERTRHRALAKRIRSADAETARRLLALALPDDIAAITGKDEIEGMRRRLISAPPRAGSVLRGRDYLEAAGIFLLVVVATFPVVVPFMVLEDVRAAMWTSQAVTVVMLFLAGFALGRHAGHDRPPLTGFLMAVFGVVLISTVKALGG